MPTPGLVPVLAPAGVQAGREGGASPPIPSLRRGCARWGVVSAKVQALHWDANTIRAAIRDSKDASILS